MSKLSLWLAVILAVEPTVLFSSSGTGLVKQDENILKAKAQLSETTFVAYESLRKLDESFKNKNPSVIDFDSSVASLTSTRKKLDLMEKDTATSWGSFGLYDEVAKINDLLGILQKIDPKQWTIDSKSINAMRTYYFDVLPSAIEFFQAKQDKQQPT